MKFLAVGLNHRTAPLDVRERVALTKEGLQDALGSLSKYQGEGVILSTCNRTEVYTLARDMALGQQAIRGFLTEYHGVHQGELAPYLYTLKHADAVRHLFRVTSSLNSMILGESQILGQVRNAYGAAVATGMARGVLSKLFHQALRVGKRARRETGIGRNALSVSYACVNLARRILGDLRGSTVLVVGVGDAGKLAARALVNNGVNDVWVTNRTYQRAQELAEVLGGTALPFEELGDALARVDIVVSSTGSPGFIIDAAILERALGYRSGRPLFLIDIAVPRDIDPSVAELPSVHLYDIDDLEAVSEANRLERQREAEKVEAIVGEEVQRFLRWWDSLEVVPTIAALRQRAEALRCREVEKTLRHLPSLTEEERRRVEALSRAMMKKLLHQPIATLREHKSPEDVQALHRLFNLDHQEP